MGSRSKDNYYIPDKAVEREKAVLVAVIRANTPEWVIEDHLDELSALADTAGADEVGRITQRRMKPDPATLIGPGKLKEISALAGKLGAKLIIFDDDLTPAQARNLEKKLPGKVIDRSGLILDIFALRARTKEAKLQVELAQLEYNYPRLTKMWAHLQSSQGGIGFRGPGETQLEVDRRLVQTRIFRLKRDLKKIKKQRETRRKGRRETPTAALVGYTNVGKSTIMNAITGKDDAFVEDRLFATLDSKVRRFEVTKGHPILVIDTVGFIRKLPHHLVASFRSTLEEAADADVIIHVADISHPALEDQLKQTKEVLADLKTGDTPVLLVFNKIDKVSGSSTLSKMQEKYTDALFVSAGKGIRIWELGEKLEAMLYAGEKHIKVSVSPDRLTELEGMLSKGIITHKEWQEGKIFIHLSGPPRELAQIVNTLNLIVE